MHRWLSPTLLGAMLLACAAPRLDVQVESATILFGPGKAPAPDTPAFVPKVEGFFTLKGLPAGASPEFRLWQATEDAVNRLKDLEPITGGTPGFQRMGGKVEPQPETGRFQLLAPPVKTQLPKGHLVVEVFLQGHLVGRGSAPFVELNLPVVRHPSSAGGGPN